MWGLRQRGTNNEDSPYLVRRSIGRAFEWLRWRRRQRHAIEPDAHAIEPDAPAIEPDATEPEIGTRTSGTFQHSFGDLHGGQRR